VRFFTVCKSVRGVSQGGTATHLTNFIFDGARADLMKGLSMDPAFQVTHSFQLASQSAPPNYSFGALFANPKVGHGWPVLFYLPLTPPQKGILQGNVDHEGNVSGRFQQSWSQSNTSKMQAQVFCHCCALE
jgi:mitochondrial import receptor subunit TOM40